MEKIRPDDSLLIVGTALVLFTVLCAGVLSTIDGCITRYQNSQSLSACLEAGVAPERCVELLGKTE